MLDEEVSKSEDMVAAIGERRERIRRATEIEVAMMVLRVSLENSMR